MPAQPGPQPQSSGSRRARSSTNSPACRRLGHRWREIARTYAEVNPGNVKQYMALANVMCVGGTWMLDSSWIKNGDWARIEACSAEAMALLDAN